MEVNQIDGLLYGSGQDTFLDAKGLWKDQKFHSSNSKNQTNPHKIIGYLNFWAELIALKLIPFTNMDRLGHFGGVQSIK